MASDSASSVQKSYKYDVFLSFRGEDTRKTFVDHLYHALQHRGITTYKDDERIEKGKTIGDQLIRSIQDSKFHIIVFSKNYASSSWCLDELVKIIECQKTKDQTAYPVFYDVEPTEVRNQSGAVGKAFAKHEKEEDAGKWRDAMKEAASLAGRELKTTFDGHESKFIQKIVEDISLELRFINSSIDGKLIGMDTRVKDVVSSLETCSNDVRIIGIMGMGGGGKTTLARAVFDHISIWFEGKSFVENVREVSKGSSSGLKKLQKRVLKDVLNEKNINVPSFYDGKEMLKKMMCNRKVLIVLDDVDDIDQLEALAGEPTWFKPGSRIIITTRDKQVLEAHRVNFIHNVNLLSHKEAICLFSRYAFGREIPINGYEELSKEVVHYAAGLPLTIKVLGSSLCGKTECEWADALERLRTIPLEQTLKRLEISYIGLENDHKEIFLDVACILKGQKMNEAIRVLESCGFRAKIGLRVLEQKSLITISDDDELCLHDHIEEMGMNIVRRLHPEEPNKHSRLWIKKEIEDIVVDNLGTKTTRSITLKYSNLDSTTIMKGLRKMKELRVLDVQDGSRAIKTDQVDHYLPNTLQSLYWSYYSFWCLPNTFQAYKLVNLAMPNSMISQLWEGGEKKILSNLKFLKLQYSKLRTFDLGMTPNLRTLDLKYSRFLVELIALDECPYLEKLNLGECGDFAKLHMPVKCPKLKFLNLCSSKVSNLNLGMTPSLEELNLKGCRDFVELHMPSECPMLKFLDLSGSKVSNLNLWMTQSLEGLYLERCKDFVELHMPVECLKLKFLNLSFSKLSNFNLEMTPSLEELHIHGCEDFVELHMPIECPKLKLLNVSSSKVNNLNLGITPSLENLERLESLTLSFKVIRHLPYSICLLKHLKFLSLWYCVCLQQLPEYLYRLECLETLDLTYCMFLRDIPNNICLMKCLKYLHLTRCVQVKKLPEQFGRLECLKELHLEKAGITHLPWSIFQLEGLCIVGSREQLESYGFTSLFELSETTCWIRL